MRAFRNRVQAFRNRVQAFRNKSDRAAHLRRMVKSCACRLRKQQSTEVAEEGKVRCQGLLINLALVGVATASPSPQYNISTR